MDVYKCMQEYYWWVDFMRMPTEFPCTKHDTVQLQLGDRNITLHTTRHEDYVVPSDNSLSRKLALPTFQLSTRRSPLPVRLSLHQSFRRTTYSRTSDSGPSEKGTVYVRHLYKGHCRRSQKLLSLYIVPIHLEPPRRGQPLYRGQNS